MEEYREEFNNQLNSRFDSFLKKHKIYFYAMFVVGLLNVINIIYLVLAMFQQVKFSFVFLVSEIVLVLIYAFVTYQFNKNKMSMRRAVTSLIIEMVFRDYETNFRPREGVALPDIIDAELCGFRRRFRYKGNSYIQITKPNSMVLDTLEVSNIRFEHIERETHDKKTSHTGEFISIHLKRGIGLLAFINTRPEAFNKITFESSKFNKYFKVYAYSQMDAFRTFSPEALDTLSEIGKDRHNSITAKIDDYKIYICVENKSFMRYLPRGSKFDFNDVENIFEDLIKIRQLIEVVEGIY